MTRLHDAVVDRDRVYFHFKPEKFIVILHLQEFCQGGYAAKMQCGLSTETREVCFESQGAWSGD